MNIEALKTELAKPEYAELTVQQVVDALNVKNITMPKPGTWATELTVLAILGPTNGEAFLAALESVAESSSVVARAIRWIRSTQGIDLGNTFTQAQLSALSDANAVPAEAVATLIAYGSKLISLAEQLGLGEVGVGVVTNARLEMETE